MSTRRAVIGLEIHVQLKTRTKLFCGDAVAFDAAPNTHVCPVCLGLPGALPVANRRAVELAVRAAAALQCRVAHTSRFTRKNYFYPDLPKGYQITQYEEPLAVGGRLTPRVGAEVRIRRAHLEEDAGKMLHDRYAGQSAIDMNRAGVPLLEIVTEPDITSPAHARAFLSLLKQTLQYTDVSDCEMEKGSLRVDANVSLVEGGVDPAQVEHTELKNLNSFAALERALHAEIQRQSAVLEAGDAIHAQTLSWNDVTGQLSVLRDKEALAEYRYISEPDLPPLVLDTGAIAALSADIGELPAQRAARLRADYALRADEAEVLTASRRLADYFEELAALSGDAHASSAWTMREVLATADARHGNFPVSPARLAEVIALVKAGTISSAVARIVFRRLGESAASAHEIVAAEGLTAISDTEQAAVWAREIVQAHPRELARYRAGESKLLEFFIGELMRKSNGRLNADSARAAATRAAQDG